MERPPVAVLHVEAPRPLPVSEIPRLCWEQLAMARQRELATTLAAILIKRLSARYQVEKEREHE